MANMILTYKFINQREMILEGNRMSCEAHLCTEKGKQFGHTFILDTGAIISTLSRNMYDLNREYFTIIKTGSKIGGFSGASILGFVVAVHRVLLGGLNTKNSMFFVPNEEKEGKPFPSVLGANVLNFIVPYPDFKHSKIWFIQNTDVPPPYVSPSLGTTITSAALIQD